MIKLKIKLLYKKEINILIIIININGSPQNVVDEETSWQEAKTKQTSSKLVQI